MHLPIREEPPDYPGVLRASPRQQELGLERREGQGWRKGLWAMEGREGIGGGKGREEC